MQDVDGPGAFPNDLTATFSVSEATRGGMEPAGATTSVRLTADGFHAAGGTGSAGQARQTLSPELVADLLTQNFARDHVRALLSHLVRLHDAL
ncbi:MAG: hypothetical protein GIX03_09500 [Candidatus Eremiobacteraeota bacterium]|nr:hypothetical protein [Candidatus Eremiobacteraeota bacterium]MBC5803206.1 hypothetical protein [Candidatus Eremiobacteraeota bacterium]MBC5822278.1 hypothetical protein [Candidatus Eremiobacteraeota bacterium]